MRTFVLNFPAFDNDGQSIERVHDYLRRMFCLCSGGFTMTPNLMGGWYDSESDQVFLESVHSYRVGFKGEDIGLRAIAEQAAEMAGQLAIYIEVDGVPEIIRTEQSKGVQAYA
jgi:hypothetical protein